MKIVLVNHYAGSPETGMEFRPYYMARLWAEAGHKVIIVAASYSHLRNKQPQIVADIEEQQIEDVNYLFVKTNTYKGNGLGRIKNMLRFTVALYGKAGGYIKKFNPDVIIASSTYPYEILPLKRLASKCKARLVFEVHDLWPMSPQLLGRYSKWHPFIFTMQCAENYAYRHSDTIISLLPCTLEHMLQHGLRRMGSVNWHYVPNGILPEEIVFNRDLPNEHSSLIATLKEQGCLLVGYAGSIGVANNIDMLIETRRLIESNNIHFIIMGKGPEKERIIAQLSEQDRKYVHFLDAVPKTLVASFLHQMDVLTMVWNKSPLYKYGISANKLFDYMMAAKPIVQALEAGNDPVMESGCGISVEPGDAGRLALAITEMAALSQAERQAFGEKGRQFVVEHHNYRVLAEKCIEIFEKPVYN